MPNAALDSNNSPERAAEMLKHMSSENSRTLYKLIVTVYEGDQAAQRYERQKQREKAAAFDDLERMRKELNTSFPKDFDPEEELQAGLAEKYGSFN